MSDSPAPHPDASAPSMRADEHAAERHATFLGLVKQQAIDLLFIGDSITRRWVDFPGLWQKYFGTYRAANFGVGGDCTQNVIWRLQNGELEGIKPRVVVLLIGTNNVPTNTGAEIASAARKIVDIIKKKLPSSKVILIALFPRGPQRRDEVTSSEPSPYYMDTIREVNKRLARLDNSADVRFLDFGGSFIGDDGSIVSSIMPDQLHIVGPGYEIWGNAMKGLLDEMMRP